MVTTLTFRTGPLKWLIIMVGVITNFRIIPLSIKAIAISFVGFVNSMVSAGVQLIFPWELSTIGSAMTFFIFGILAILGLLFILWKVPETKGKSLEELEAILIKK